MTLPMLYVFSDTWPKQPLHISQSFRLCRGTNRLRKQDSTLLHFQNLTGLKDADLADPAQEFPAHKLLQKCKACSSTHTEFLPQLPHHHSGKADICRDRFQPYILQWLVLSNVFWPRSRALPLPAHIMVSATHSRKTFILNSYNSDISTFRHAKLFVMYAPAHGSWLVL